MSGTQKGAEPAASVEEDPNAAVTCSSPPCFMHELDPSYLGYLPREEVRARVAALLAAEWGDAGPDQARLRAALRRHLEGLEGRPDREPGASGEALCHRPDRLVPTVRQALPRIHDDALRRDLEEALGALERGAPNRDVRRDKG
jgi:hypothetical protein